MLPSEFYERTGVTLSGEEYAEVEKLYNAVKMDKDEFCKQWLENRDNQLLKELMDSYKVGELYIQSLESELKDKEGRAKKERAGYEKELEEERRHAENHMKDFARKLILRTEEVGVGCLDLVEEEMGYGFIIQVKLEENLTLTDNEREYLVGKIKQYNL